MKKNFTNILGKNSGIYEIINHVNNKVYIGSAVCLNRRFSSHSSSLLLGTGSSYLQKSYNLHGTDNFTMNILELVPSKKDLLFKEQKWIDEKFDNQKNCYNISPTAGSCLGVVSSPEKRKKLSIACKSNWKNNSSFIKKMLEIAERRRTYYQFLSPENKIFAGKGLEIFCKKNMLNTGHMLDVLSGKAASYKGWRLPSNKEYKFNRKEHCKALANANAVSFNVVVQSPTGEKFGPIINLKKFCENHNLHRRSVRKLIHGEIKQTKGWVAITQINKD